MSKRDPSVYFVGGYTPRKDLMGTISYACELEDTDAEHTIFYMYNLDNDYWSQEQFDHEIVSVEYQKIKGKPAWYLLSKRGVVSKFSQSGISEDLIRGAGTGPGLYGYVCQIKKIDNALYVCGMCRQVFKKMKNKWVSIADDILAHVDSVDYCFNAIDGSNISNIYAVGWQGEIYHYNGKKWTQCDSPTNVDLYAVKCIDESTVYICGRGGVFLYGSKNNWTIVQDEKTDDNLWSIEVFKNILFVASYSELYSFDGSTLKKVDTKLNPAPDSSRLHANNEILWSFGNNDLVCFDGKKWRRVMCPDNM